MPINALIGSSLISGGAGFLSGLISGRQQRKAIQAQIKAQAEENQKTREYNLMLAQQQNAWNVQQYEQEQSDALAQWNRQNEYDSPAAQMARFKAAGLNPNLIYGQMNDGSVASTPSIAGSLTSGAPATPQDMSALGRKPTLGDALNNALEYATKTAQLNSINASTKKTKEDTNELLTTRDVRQQLLSNQLQTSNIEVLNVEYDWSHVKPKQFELLTKQLNEVDARITQMQQATENAKAQLQNIDQDTLAKKISNLFAGKRYEMELKIMAAQLFGISLSNVNLGLQNQLKSKELEGFDEMFRLDAEQKRLTIDLTYANNPNLDIRKQFAKGEFERGSGMWWLGAFLSFSNEYSDLMKKLVEIKAK